jgi:hypothetical protein
MLTSNDYGRGRQKQTKINIITSILDIALNMPFAGGRRCVQVRLQKQHE